MNAGAVPPHPTLHRYYSSDGERAGVVGELFDAGAPFYERICRLMSLGSGERYRRNALRNAGLKEGMRILDIATGTGVMLRSAASLSGNHGLAIGLDPSAVMLRECRERCAAPLLQGQGQHLPFASAGFDMISMGYALRHVPDLRSLFHECRRVLKPGGRLLLLEITQPRSHAGRWITRIYLRSLVPGLARITTGSEAAGKMMDYFWDTIENCVPPEVILTTLHEAGFRDAHRKVTGGIFSEYLGTKS